MERYKLQNGCTIILKHKESRSVHVQISVNVGSIHEKKGEKGYSHLIEHLLFEGTKKRKDAKKIAETIENIGGELNAATSNEQTYYYVKVRDEHYEKAIDVLSDMIIHPLFEKEKIEKEKKVVLEEIKMITDQPRYYQWIFFEKILFRNTSYSDPVHGYEKDVEEANYQKIKNYYKRHYFPKNAIITLIGNIEKHKSDIKKCIEKYFGNWENTQKPIYKKTILPTNSQKFAVEKRAIQQTYIIQGIITPPIQDKFSPVIEIIDAILGKPQSGRINNEVRNKNGLSYDVSVSYQAMRYFGFFAINAGFDPKNLEKIKRIFEKEFMLKNITEQELKNAKEYIIGKISLELEDPAREAEMLIFWEQTMKKDYTEEYIDKIKKVTLEDIEKVKKIFEKRTEIMIIPE